MEKEDWIVQFVTELTVRLKPPLPRKFAYTLATHRWTTHRDKKPDEAAKA